MGAKRASPQQSSGALCTEAGAPQQSQSQQQLRMGHPALMGGALAATCGEQQAQQQQQPGLAHPPLLRTLAATCSCSLAIGWIIGCWGGVVASPTFLAAFFPHSVHGGGGSGSDSGNSGDSTSSGSHYCMFSDQLLSLSGSCIYLSAVPAVAVAARATHTFGRKPTMAAIAALLIVGAGLGAAGQHLALVFVSRLLLGAAMGCSFQAPTMLLAEVLPRSQRGAGLFAYNTAMLLGFLLSAVANLLLHKQAWGWRCSIALLAVPGLAVAGLLPSMPDSPQALLQRGNEAAAEQALRRLRLPGADVSEELGQMRASAARAAALSRGRDRLRAMAARANRPAIVASALYPLVLMLTGLNVLSTWMPNLLLALGATPAWALTGNTLMMAVGLAAALPSVLFVERVGRRTLLAAGGAVVAAAMLLLGAVLAVWLPGSADAGPAPAALLPVALLLLCVQRAALSCTLQPLAAAVPAEVQPLQIRSDASSLTASVRNSSSFFVTQFTLPLLCAMRWGVFLVFGVCTLLGVVALWLLVPETRGLPLESVQHAFAEHWLWGQHAHHAPDASAQLPAAKVDSSLADVEVAADGRIRSKDFAVAPPPPPPPV